MIVYSLWNCSHALRIRSISSIRLAVCNSDFLKIEQGENINPTFDTLKKIAESLKRSAEESLRRKGTAFQSAMSMLNFYINRAGKNLKPDTKKVLEQAKIELRRLFNKV